MMPDTRYRTDDPEIMDDFSLEGGELADALDKIAKINRLLGGNKLTLQGVAELTAKIHANNFTIVDAGCGNGDMLRAVCDFGRKKKLNFQLIGIDANSFTIDYAKRLSNGYPEITYYTGNFFDDRFRRTECDVILCTLTLHHFKDSEIETLIRNFLASARVGIVINDLQRSKIAYRLFKLVSVVFGLNEMSTKDGLVSILRGFKRSELIGYSKRLDLKNYKIRWKWAFRYQWIISKI